MSKTRITKAGSNKLWVPLLTTIGIGAAIFGLQKFKNGKYMRPIQNIFSKDNNIGMLATPGLSTANAITEFSKEIVPDLLNTNEAETLESRIVSQSQTQQ